MEALTTRPWAPADAPALADLLNLLETHGGGHPGYTAAELVPLVDHTVRDPAADSRMVWTADRLAAFALVPTPPDNGFRVDLWGGVRPEFQGKGLGRELLDWQLRRAAEIHKDTTPDAGWELHASCLVAEEPAQRLFRRFDLKPARYWFEMSAPLPSSAASALPSGLRAVAYSPDVESTLYEVHTAAFADHWGYQRRGRAEWTALTVRSDGFLPGLSALAFDGNEIAGYVLSYQDGDPHRIYIGQVGVPRRWRRRGIAAALLTRVLGSAAAQGFERVDLSVDADSPTGAVGVYERVGFAVASRSVTYAASLPR